MRKDTKAAAYAARQQKAKTKEEAAYHKMVRDSLYWFGVHMGWKAEKTAPFHFKIVEALEKVERFEIEKLILVAPPRHGKTKWVSEYFPAWLIGKHPDKKIISVTNASPLAEQNATSVRRMIAEPKYQTIFGNPLATFEGARDNKSIMDLAEGGTYKGDGITATWAGFGANWCIIDDPIRKREEAESVTQRDKVWDGWNSDIKTRLEYPAAVIVMHTRWHDDDLVGRILRGADADEWVVLHFPKVQDDEDCELRPYDPREPGEPLWPLMFWEKGGKRTPEQARVEYLRRFELAKVTDPYATMSLDQGRPYTKTGNMFEDAWFKRYTSEVAGIAARSERVFIAIDATYTDSKKSDRVGVAVIGRIGVAYYVLEAFGRRMGFLASRACIEGLIDKYPKATLIIEPRANGQALFEEFEKVVPSIAKFEPGNESKASRVEYLASVCEAGNMYWPTDQMDPGIAEAIDEVKFFGSRRFDDIPDACSMVIIHDRGRRRAGEGLKRAVESAKGGLEQFINQGALSGLFRR